MIEPKLNEIFWYNELKLKCIEGNECKKCTFHNNIPICFRTICRPERRKDKKDVIIILIQEK